jgi:mannose-6-phosphate isomerase-like protein (cupin superfamily)
MQHQSATIGRFVRRGRNALFVEEHNCKLRRLFPWASPAVTSRLITRFDVMWVELDGGKTLDRQSYGEEEAIIVVGGHAEIVIDGRSAVLARGDVVHVPPFAERALRNLSMNSPLIVVAICWL